MTCIVGYRANGTLWMGGDSAGVELDGDSIVVRADEKVFANGPYLFGIAGSFRVGNLLRYGFAPPREPRNVSTIRFLNTTFIEALRKCFKERGVTVVKDNAEEIPGEFLVGYKGILAMVHEDLQVGMSVMPYAAVGAGAAPALGAMYALTRASRPPSARQAVLTALRAAQYLTTCVREPFVIRSMKP